MTGLRNFLKHPLAAAIFAIGAAFVLLACAEALHTAFSLPFPIAGALLLPPGIVLLLDGRVRRKKALRRLHFLMGLLTVPWLYALICLLGLWLTLRLLPLFGYAPDAHLRLLLGILFAAVWLLILAWGAISAGFLRVRRKTLSLGCGAGRKIALLSDFHLGIFTSLRALRRTVRKVSAEKPDLILIPGDFFDLYFDDLRHPEGIASLLKTLSAPLGVYGCEGNHDRFCFAESEEGRKFLSECGVTLLRDEGLRIEDFYLYGRKDEGDESRLSAKELPLPAGLPAIVLDHRPSDIPALASRGAAAVLCGHTHGGQTFPGDLLLRILSRYNLGERHTGATYSHTTAGCGRWGIPCRFLTGDEIVILELV